MQEQEFAGLDVDNNDSDDFDEQNDNIEKQFLD